MDRPDVPADSAVLAAVAVVVVGVVAAAVVVVGPVPLRPLAVVPQRSPQLRCKAPQSAATPHAAAAPANWRKTDAPGKNASKKNVVEMQNEN